MRFCERVGGSYAGIGEYFQLCLRLNIVVQLCFAVRTVSEIYAGIINFPNEI